MRIQLFSLIVALLPLSACSHLVSKYPDSSDPIPELTTTGVGAAAGAAVGAGLGAIVGSTTGSAGGGLVIGSVAGAAIGGGIGYGFEQQENKQEELNEKIARQDETIATQQREVETLRESLRDEFEMNNRPSLPSSGNTYGDPQDYSFDNYRGNPRARRFAKAELQEFDNVRTDIGSQRFQEGSQRFQEGSQRFQEPSRFSERSAPLPRSGMSPAGGALPPANTALPRANTLPKARRVMPAVSQQEDIAPPPAAVRVPRYRESEGARTIQRARTSLRVPEVRDEETIAVQPKVVTRSGKVSEPKRVVSKRASKPIEVAKPLGTSTPKIRVAPKKVPAAAPVKVAAVTSPPVGSDCAQAEQEFFRSQDATSDADKLFYLRRALKLCPKNPKYHLETGSVYQKIGRNEDARFEYQQVLAIDPDNALAHQQLNSLEERYSSLEY